MKDFDMTIPAIYDIHEYWVLKKGQNYFKRWTPTGLMHSVCQICKDFSDLPGGGL